MTTRVVTSRMRMAVHLRAPRYGGHPSRGLSTVARSEAVKFHRRSLEFTRAMVDNLRLEHERRLVTGLCERVFRRERGICRHRRVTLRFRRGRNGKLSRR